MARQIRIEFRGAVYHVLARGNNKQLIYLDPIDRKTFLTTIGQCCERTGFEVYAWVLMGNHYHLVLHTPNGNLVDGMRWLQNTYTRRFNLRHERWGRLFGDRYKSILVEGGASDSLASSGSYLASLVDYVHLNPARAGIIRASKGENLLDYKWSSLAQGFALPPSKRFPWHDVRTVLAMDGLSDTTADRRKYALRLEKRMRSEEAENCGLIGVDSKSLQSTLRRGWYWGSQTFQESLLAKIAEAGAKVKSRTYSATPEYRDRSKNEADAILVKAAKFFDLPGPGAIAKLGRGDRRRVAIAWAIWKKTSMPQAWIAEATGLRTPANVSQQVARFDRRPSQDLAAVEKRWKSEFDI